MLSFLVSYLSVLDTKIPRPIGTGVLDAALDGAGEGVAVANGIPLPTNTPRPVKEKININMKVISTNT